MAHVPLLLFVTEVLTADQASFVSNSGNVTGEYDPLHFDLVHINKGGWLDQETWQLHIESFGLFLVTLSAGHPGAGTSTNYTLHRNGEVMTSVTLTASSSATDNTIGHDIVSHFSQQEELHIRSNSSNLYSTPTGKLTSWGVVSLSQAMGVEVGFAVCKMAPNEGGKLTYDQVCSNVGNAWDADNNRFVAPESGIYFFSFSIGASSSNNYLRLFVNGEALFTVYRSRPSPVPTELFSRAVMILLLANDQVHVESQFSGFSDFSCLTTFSGFLFSSLRDEQLAWAVYRSFDQFGMADPLEYENVMVNEGAVWFDDRAHCHLSGLYYVNICAGIYGNYNAQLAVMKGSVVQGELVRVSNTSPYEDMICRSMIIQCNAWETLRVTVSSSSYLWGGESIGGNLISFMGFYLFP